MKAYLVAAMLAMLMPGAAVAQTIVLEPMGEWAISSDAESCTLTRPYTARNSGDTTLYIRSYGPYSPTQISIVGPTMVRDDSRAVLATIGFDERPSLGNVGAIANSYQDQPMLVFQLRLPRSGNNPMNLFGVGAVDEATSTGQLLPWDAQLLHIDLPDKEPQALRFASLGIALALIEDCEDQLVASWGFDPAQEHALQSSPVLTNRDQLAYWIHYPVNLVRNHISRIAQLRVRVGADGAVEDCLIQAPSWSRDVLAQACRTITGSANFAPARAANGDPVPALWRASIMFLISD